MRVGPLNLLWRASIVAIKVDFSILYARVYDIKEILRRRHPRTLRSFHLLPAKSTWQPQHPVLFRRHDFILVLDLRDSTIIPLDLARAQRQHMSQLIIMFLVGCSFLKQNVRIGQFQVLRHVLLNAARGLHLSKFLRGQL